MTMHYDSIFIKIINKDIFFKLQKHFLYKPLHFINKLDI